jgi:homoserine dehydrogenase
VLPLRIDRQSELRLVCNPRQFDPQLAGAIQIQLKRIDDEPRCPIPQASVNKIGAFVSSRCPMQNIEVLKFGSSVLRSANELHVVVDEIYRRWRGNCRVLAVVSAFEGVTDQLIREAADLVATDTEEATASYIAQGEQRTAALLVEALTQAGIPSRVIEPHEIALRAEGGSLDSTPVGVNLTAFGKLWDFYPILVLPGFYGIDAQGNTALFGRGGSDMSALFLAGALSASCRLLKDVDGVYDADPAKRTLAHRYSALSWETATKVAGPLIQPKGLKYAQGRVLPFHVGRPNENASTHVGQEKDQFSATAPALKPLRVALLGCGVVGRGVYELLAKYPERFKVCHVVVRNLEKYLDIPERTTEPSPVLDSSVDIIVECFGGIATALPIIVGALRAGKYVVTANKAVLAAHWAEVAHHTRGSQRKLFFSAAAGGALPVMETLEHLARKTPIVEVRGVINGTCGVILEARAQGMSEFEAIECAQSQGFAEANPFRDISGLDSADKLALMIEKAFGQWIPPHQIATRGIDTIEDHHRGYKLIARARQLNTGIFASVAPEVPPPGSFLREAKGAENRVEIELSNGKIIRLHGQGAGRKPTAVSVMADLHEVARRFESAQPQLEIVNGIATQRRCL